MKILGMFFCFGLCGSAFAADSVVFNGVDYSGKPCSLTVLNPNSLGGENGDWASFHTLVTTTWQAPGSLPLDAHLSPTNYSLYAKSSTNDDSIAVDFNIPSAPALENILAFTFQTKDSQHHLFQDRCHELVRVNTELH